MGTTYIRDGMHSVNPYLVVRGADELLTFITKVFDGQQRLRVPTVDGKVQHSEIRVDDMVLELADGNAIYPPVPMALHSYVPDVDAFYACAIEAGATSAYEPRDTGYGDRESAIRHPSGILWYISTRLGASYKPEGLRAVTPYLHPRGANDLIAFMKEAFGGDETEGIRNNDGTVAHAKVRIGDSIIELGDAHGEWGPMGANLHLYVPDVDATYKQAVHAGAKSQQAPADAPYGDRSAGVTDNWGNQWWIATYIEA